MAVLSSFTCEMVPHAPSPVLPALLSVMHADGGCIKLICTCFHIGCTLRLLMLKWGLLTCLSVCLSACILCTGPAPTARVAAEILTDGICWDCNCLEVCAEQTAYSNALPPYLCGATVIYYHPTCVGLQ